MFWPAIFALVQRKAEVIYLQTKLNYGTATSKHPYLLVVYFQVF